MKSHLGETFLGALGRNSTFLLPLVCYAFFTPSQKVSSLTRLFANLSQNSQFYETFHGDLRALSTLAAVAGGDRLEVYTFKATPFRNYGFFLEKTTRILEKFYLNFHQNEEGDAVPRGCK